ncbi:MAG: hypothetical protein J6J36_07535 [Clostridia bacterium]|nr:hypothetical protein [Clostridia bacterium]
MARGHQGYVQAYVEMRNSKYNPDGSLKDAKRSTEHKDSAEFLTCKCSILAKDSSEIHH